MTSGQQSGFYWITRDESHSISNSISVTILFCSSDYDSKSDLVVVVGGGGNQPVNTASPGCKTLS